MESGTPFPERGRVYSLAEYLELEEQALEKHEFLDGYVFATPPEYPDRLDVHNRIIRNVHRGLLIRMGALPHRVEVSNSGRACITISEPGQPVPLITIDVRSPTGGDDEAVRKFHRLLQVPAFRESVVICQYEPQVIVTTRCDDGTWRLRDSTRLEESAAITAIGVQLPLRGIYEGVTFLTLADTLQQRHL